jgi:cardiolipin synthase (CMP-forming)
MRFSASTSWPTAWSTRWYPEILLRHLPNLFTLLRLALTPVIALAILDQRFRDALLLCMLAGVSDGIDGQLARRFNWQSRAGAILDPLADKALLMIVFISLGIAWAIPRWLVWLVVGRDAMILLMAVCALAFTKIRVFPPSWWGKVSTTVQLCSAVTFMAARAWPHPVFGVLVPLGIVLTAAATLWSGLHYAWLGWRAVR